MSNNQHFAIRCCLTQGLPHSLVPPPNSSISDCLKGRLSRSLLLTLYLSQHPNLKQSVSAFAQYCLYEIFENPKRQAQCVVCLVLLTAFSACPRNLLQIEPTHARQDARASQNSHNGHPSIFYICWRRFEEARADHLSLLL